MQHKIKKIQFIYIIYWLLLAYTIAALVFWFISLNQQNKKMAEYRMDLQKNSNDYPAQVAKIENDKKRKTAQYLGEGITFFLVILAGAIFIFRSVRRQLKQSIQQQNFMMAITHELKTPIAVAQLNLETLQKRKLEETQQQKLITNTLQETVRLNTLCNNILLSSQIDAGGYRTTNEELNLSQLVDDCIQEFSNRLPHKHFIRNIQPEIFVMGDSFLLQIAVNNLIDNAIKYSNKSSDISIHLRSENKIFLTIEDQGVGISSDDKKKVFQKFYRAGNSATKTAKGTGLGLYLTLKVVEAHHGNIFLKDNHPTGSIFTIELKPADKQMA